MVYTILRTQRADGAYAVSRSCNDAACGGGELGQEHEHIEGAATLQAARELIAARQPDAVQVMTEHDPHDPDVVEVWL
jgi:hypothetical protein